MVIELDSLSGKCSCGRTHSLQVRQILIESGALSKLPQLLEACGSFTAPVAICDSNTRFVAEQVASMLPDVQILILDSNGLHADEHAVEQVEQGLPAGCDLLLAIGSGTIHDITRYVAAQHKLPFVSVPTAASVDGFVSTVAAMTWRGFKVTFPAVSPVAVVADSDIFANAPQRLNAAGVADLLGKYTALSDWKIASLLTGEYFCTRIAQLETQALNTVTSMLSAIRAGEREACEHLMYALLLSGLAMQMTRNSRPASGSEHHFSHLWEMHVLNPEVDALHGEKVGVGLAVACEVYHGLLAHREQVRVVESYVGLPMEELRHSFGNLYESIVKENTPDPMENLDPETVELRMGEIYDIIAALPTPKQVRELLHQAGCPQTMEDLGLDPAILNKSIRFSPLVRSRLTLMRVATTLFEPYLF